MQKPTPGGVWLREKRRALGLTADALGGALGVPGNSITAVECGARRLSPQLRARAEAYLSQHGARKPAGERKFPPDDRVRAVAWIRPMTLAAALREAMRKGLDFERVLGGWADRGGEEPADVERALGAALRAAIDDLGPITRNAAGRAAKRIVGQWAKATSAPRKR
jgi:transcriptional regulator with XRE-family HTH domain